MLADWTRPIRPLEDSGLKSIPHVAASMGGGGGIGGTDAIIQPLLSAYRSPA